MPASRGMWRKAPALLDRSDLNKLGHGAVTRLRRRSQLLGVFLLCGEGAQRRGPRSLSRLRLIRAQRHHLLVRHRRAATSSKPLRFSASISCRRSFTGRPGPCSLSSFLGLVAPRRGPAQDIEPVLGRYTVALGGDNGAAGPYSGSLPVFRVEIRAYNAERAALHPRDLDGFTVGDSGSGRWSETLDGLPADIAELTITFVGNASRAAWCSRDGVTPPAAPGSVTPHQGAISDTAPSGQPPLIVSADTQCGGRFPYDERR